MRKDVCVSLDVSNLTWALHVMRATEDVAWGYKVGLRLVMMYGLRVVLSNLSETSLPMVLDLKLHDIPSTTLRNCEMVHALLRDVEPRELYVTAHPDSVVEDSPVPLLCVTSLTSRPLGNVDGVMLARGMGAAGVVCSGHEAHAVRKAWPAARIFCPGVRLPSAEVHDQTRVCTPAEARENGADVLIVGRPIYEATDPISALRSFL